MRPHGHARISRTSPRAIAVCDRCGRLFNHSQLQWQYDWRGPRLQNLRILVCESCLDMPQEQLRTITLPADPQPIMNPRPEQYSLDDNPISSIGTSIGTMLMGGGLNAAFDSNINKPLQLCAQISPPVLGYNNSVGRYFTNSLTITRATISAPNNAPFFSGGAVLFKLQGSLLPVGFTDLYSGTTVGTNGESLSFSLTTTGLYPYYQVVFNGTGTGTMAISQFQLYQ